jgi:hypothetical protein
MEYLVLSLSSAYKTGSYALQGKYFGQVIGAGVKVGAGIQVLVGGFEKSFTLQPLSVGTGRGTGIGVGMGYLYLQKDPTK